MLAPFPRLVCFSVTFHVQIRPENKINVNCNEGLTPGMSPLEKPPVVKVHKNFPEVYVTQRLIIVFTVALHWSLSSTRSVQSIPLHSLSQISILILSTHLRLRHRGGLLLAFPPIFYTQSPSLFMLHVLHIASSFTYSS
jgi:hypothetical protein